MATYGETVNYCQTTIQAKRRDKTVTCQPIGERHGMTRYEKTRLSAVNLKAKTSSSSSTSRPASKEKTNKMNEGWERKNTAFYSPAGTLRSITDRMMCDTNTVDNCTYYTTPARCPVSREGGSSQYLLRSNRSRN